MDDSAHKAAVARLTEIGQLVAQQRNAITDATAKLQGLQAEQAEVEAWIAMWHRFSGTDVPVAAERNEIGLPVVKRKRPKNPDRIEVVDKAVEIIRAHGKPLGRKVLFNALAENGVVLKGKDAEMVLSTMLWRSKDRIVRLVPHGYWLRDESYPEADYASPEYEARHEG